MLDYPNDSSEGTVRHTSSDPSLPLPPSVVRRVQVPQQESPASVNRRAEVTLPASSPLVIQKAPLPHFGTKDIRLTDHALQEKMEVSRTGPERTLSPPPPRPQAVSRREPARTKEQRVTHWYTGMTCLVPECRQTAPFRYLDNYLRHYQEIH